MLSQEVSSLSDIAYKAVSPGPPLLWAPDLDFLFKINCQEDEQSKAGPHNSWRSRRDCPAQLLSPRLDSNELPAFAINFPVK